MPGLMARLSLIFKAKFSKALDRAENPNETLDYSYEEQLRQLQNVKRGIADVRRRRSGSNCSTATMQQQVDKLDGQAKQALQAGREDLARRGARPARRRCRRSSRARLAGPAARGPAGEARRGREGPARPRSRPSARRRKWIKAQYSAAEAQVRIGEAATGIGEHMADVGLAVQRARTRPSRCRPARARSTSSTRAGSLEDFTSSGDDLDRQLAADLQGTQVDDELAKMKAELGTGRARQKEDRRR